MFYFPFESLLPKETYKNVIVRLVQGKELKLNYFELKNREVKIPFHEHPEEHLVIVLEGEIEFIFESKTQILKNKDCLFIPAKKKHTARVIKGSPKALEIYRIQKDG